MSERMTPIPFAKLLERLVREYEKSGTVFAVRRKFEALPRSLPLFGGKIETPFGPAAGPNTQLAQNIVAGYFAGARFFELKTVQKLDGEAIASCIPRPCILAADEGYNCEWSTELTVQQAFREYVNAYVAIKLISKVWKLGDPNGFVFNMSVGYDLAGIQTPKLNSFIDGLTDASTTPEFQEALSAAETVFPNEKAFIRAIDPHICRSVTISTLHGCPPQEIESIATYLITEKKLHTLVKCNPTILGYDFARSRLNEANYDYISFDDHHFKEDLQYKDAVPMFRRLLALAEENGVSFGVKLSNTCPVDVKAGELPGQEMYMSGRSLYLLTIEMAARLSKEFNGRLRISFSGGADAFNLKKLFRAGIWPITVATTLLKPGGYDRFSQLAKEACQCAYKPFDGVDFSAVETLSEEAAADPHYQKPLKPLESRKLSKAVPLLDCFMAPCQEGCPIHQDIPGYLALNGQKEYAAALRLIAEKNPLPFITGTICAHRCMSKCTRNFYEEPVEIRRQKLNAARKGYGALIANPPKKEALLNASVAVIGGGPAGLGAAYYFSKAGAAVTVYEKEEKLGGTVQQVIPAFRIPQTAIDKDVRLVKALGASFVTGKAAPSFEELDGKFDYILLAVGAGRSALLNIGEPEYNAVSFLRNLKAKKQPAPGKNVVVVGGGNTAMDAARAAKRLPGVESVTIVYRRSKKYMPAEQEEMGLALKDGVVFRELLNPVRLAGGLLLCRKMRLGELDASGRRKPVETEETVLLPCDALLSALGEKRDETLLKEYGAAFDEKGRPLFRSGKVFVLGDALRGPATVVEAMSDGQRALTEILGKLPEKALPENSEIPLEKALLRKGELTHAGGENRCLRCSLVCENCVSACPNRANVAVAVPGKKQEQILHLDYLCNECGNCAVFCPYESAPYKDKLTLFATEKDFADSENSGFLVLNKEKLLIKARLNSQVFEADLQGENPLPKDVEALILTVLRDYPYLLC